MSEVKINSLSGINQINLVECANKICDGIDCDFNKESLNMCGDLFDSGKVFYLNPTEELRMGDFVKKGSRIATVLGSGDFAIDSIYHGVKNVTCFDINKYQYFPASLKIKALQYMNYEDYCNFFCDNKVDIKLLNMDMYEKIKDISENNEILYTFMDIIVKRFNEAKNRIKEDIINDPFYSIIHNMYVDNNTDSSRIKKFVEKFDECLIDNTSELYLSFLFSVFGIGYAPPEVISLFHGLETFKRKNSYLENECSFNDTKELISNSKIDFVNCDVSKLESILKNKGYVDSSFRGFQSIYLSNIPEYMRGDYFVNNVICKLMNLLEDDGIIVYCCQGVTKDDLHIGKSAVFDIINDPDNYIADRNPLNRIRLVNDICGYELLKQGDFDISLNEAESLCVDNGYHDKDTFIYIKKK